MQDPETATFIDRIVRLRAGGALLLFGSLLAAGLSGLQFFAMVLIPGLADNVEVSDADRSMFLVGGLFYGAAALLLMIFGIGSWLARRWARALILALAWLGLGVGTFAMLVIAVCSPMLMAWTKSGAMDAGGGRSSGEAMADGVLVFVLFLILTMGFVFYVALPGCFVLIYRGRDVKATCEVRDPQPSWTDAVPTPVISLACALWLGAASLLLSAYYPSLPFFGWSLSGAHLLLTCLSCALALAFVGVGVSRRSPAAWWACLGLLVLGALSTVLTFTRLGVHEIYSGWGMPVEQVQLVADLLESPALRGGALLGFAAYLGFLLWVRRYFGAGESA